ncbi:unnamed protein product, partial [Prorocentrum cordatum]
PGWPTSARPGRPPARHGGAARRQRRGQDAAPGRAAPRRRRVGLPSAREARQGAAAGGERRCPAAAGGGLGGALRHGGLEVHPHGPRQAARVHEPGVGGGGAGGRSRPGRVGAAGGAGGRRRGARRARVRARVAGQGGRAGGEAGGRREQDGRRRGRGALEQQALRGRAVQHLRGAARRGPAARPGDVEKPLRSCWRLPSPCAEEGRLRARERGDRREPRGAGGGLRGLVLRGPASGGAGGLRPPGAGRRRRRAGAGEGVGDRPRVEGRRGVDPRARGGGRAARRHRCPAAAPRARVRRCLRR